MERLQKTISHAGIASRRKAEEIILSGRVKVNGKVEKKLGTKVGEHDQVEVDEVPISKERPVYFLLYKPHGVITSVKDEKKRKTVLDFFEDVNERVYPVGRLDYDTSGLLLLTNDGQLDYELTHPKFEINKTYVAKIQGKATVEELNKLKKGVKIDGKETSPAKIKVIDSTKENSIVQITIHEGRNHEVKKMFKAIDHPVLKLKRESFGNINLGKLQPGEWRPLKKVEVDKLKNLIDTKKP